MTLNIILFNKDLAKYGYKTFNICLLVLITCSFFVENKKIMFTIAIVNLILMIIGIGIANYCDKNYKIIGYLSVEEFNTKISIMGNTLELLNCDYYIEFSYSGYLGESNYIPFLSLGAFTTKSGINSITIYNETQKVNCDVVIYSEKDYLNLKNLISQSFKHKLNNQK